MRVGVTTTLPNPVTLCTDMSFLSDLVQEIAWCSVIMRAQACSIPNLSESHNFAQHSLQQMQFFNDEITAEKKPNIEDRLQKCRQWIADMMHTSKLLDVSLEADVDLSNELNYELI